MEHGDASEDRMIIGYDENIMSNIQFLRDIMMVLVKLEL
jgi:hypothetical protein